MDLMSPVLLALGCLLVVAGIPLIRFMEGKPDVPIWIIVLIFIGSSLFHDDRLPIVNLGVLSINPLDVAAPILFALAFPFVFFRLRDGFGKKDLALLMLLVWSGILLFNYVLGLREFGLQVATNEFRGYFYIICVSLYVASLRIVGLWYRIEYMFIFGTLCLLIVILIGFTGADFSRTGRPVGSAQALFVLQSLLIGIFIYDRGHLKRYLVPLFAALVPILIILQHRSIWVVMLCSLGLVLWLLPLRRAELIQWGMAGMLVLGGLFGVIFGAKLVAAVAGSYEEAVSVNTTRGTSTFAWRMQGWHSLLTGKQMNTVGQILLGNSFGAGWERKALASDGVLILRTESPHNFYVQTILRSGMIGLTAFLILHVTLIRGLLRSARTSTQWRSIYLCLVVLVISQMIYYIPYGSDFIQAILLGAAIGWVRESDNNMPRNECSD